MKKVALLIILNTFCLYPQNKYFERTYIWEYVHGAHHVFSSNQQYIDVFGSTIVSVTPEYITKGFMLRLNPNGDTIMLKEYASPYTQLVVYDAIKTQFGYAIATCVSQYEGDEGCKAGILLLNTAGDVLYSGYAGELPLLESRARSILQTSDGGYLLAGLITPTTGSTNKLYVVKLKADGITEWEKVYDYFPYHNSFRGILHAPGGGYYAIASIRRWVEYSSTFPLTSQYIGDILLYKLDDLGNVEWQRIYFEEGQGEQAHTFCQAPDGSLFIGGSRDFTDLLVKLDTEFNVAWSIHDENSGCGPSLVSITPDGNFLVSGCTTTSSNAANAYIKKISPSGSIKWKRIYG
ncbi:MAG TPA: hypothetical protein PK239_19225, partial [Chitinophagales bacterium]|nr:hypothetical protein [Chitinophagales bacterium]HRK29418.1 hypothetical protein [Chitinophagales bacterium]